MAGSGMDRGAGGADWPLPPSSFEVHCMGQIESAYFPAEDNLYCQFSVQHGNDWQVLAGMESGITQVASVPGGAGAELVWNFPLDLTFKSTNVYGWPQLVLGVHGNDFLNRHVIKGYGSVHLPTVPGSHELHVRMFRPLSSSPLQQFIGWINGTPPEYIDAKRPAMPTGREVTRVESVGVVVLKIHIVTRNMSRFGYSLPTHAASAVPAV
eukprot:CAMPEP_0206242710 /NCGR_PEP_ID=MMETSP0047_2-20121206/17205_1 /ASSEMBLY_ACC=CAM_ASM_000192 /TAXON_ID=195065 /ORGANISM="Chroomonas mesostigmatica_cf, Strain CCMP1168" /LENGTH=209 /DNA_ID=CAMNT_0053667753 /DNA_START=68 /DNA_END=697 /DNA_ORIENTATION=+